VQLKRIQFNSSENSIRVRFKFDDNFRRLQLIQILSIKGGRHEKAGDVSSKIAPVNRFFACSLAPPERAPDGLRLKKPAIPAPGGFTPR
jgi:hypothetical protein